MAILSLVFAGLATGMGAALVGVGCYSSKQG
jgi:hypothetical protein